MCNVVTAAGGQGVGTAYLVSGLFNSSSMGSRAARSLLGPLVDKYRDLETSKQSFDRPSVSPFASLSAVIMSPLFCYAPWSTRTLMFLHTDNSI